MSKEYRVIVQPEALEGINTAHQWIRAHDSDQATVWVTGLMKAIQSLRIMPLRCSLAFENEYFEEEIRQILYGKQGMMYRVLFTVKEDEVHILFVRHTAQAPVERD